MSNARRALLLAAALWPTALTSQQPKAAASPLTGAIEYLWPEGAPLAHGDQDRDRPNLSVYLAPADQAPADRAPADRATGMAVVVCPGGGYGALATGHEGHDVGVFFTQHGISAFILTYRIAPEYHHPCPLLDVQRAVRLVRARAAQWHVDPAHIGVLGFSAGGHLASTLLTHFDGGDPDAQDPIDRVGCRPDFGVLVYPVIALDRPYTHQGSKRNLLGDQATDLTLVTDLSTAHRVDAHTPPCFLVHTSADTVVPPENSIDFYLALRRAKVPAELHIYEKGQHGFGLAPKDPVLSTWPEHLLAWLQARR